VKAMANRSFFSHPRAIVDTKSVGARTKVWAFVHILEDARVGSDCNICEHCFIENDVIIGNRVTIKSGVYIWDGVRIEDDVFLGPNATFTNDLYPRSKVYRKYSSRIIIRKGASIGASATLLPGITIGRYAMIGAGSVVTKDVGDYELVYGNPAQHHGYICSCKEKLILKKNKVMNCSCGLSYQCKRGVISIV